MRDITRSTSDPTPTGGLEVISDGPVGRRQYTFVPKDADDHERCTTWITVDEGTLVDLSEKR